MDLSDGESEAEESVDGVNNAKEEEKKDKTQKSE